VEQYIQSRPKGTILAVCLEEDARGDHSHSRHTNNWGTPLSAPLQVCHNLLIQNAKLRPVETDQGQTSPESQRLPSTLASTRTLIHCTHTLRLRANHSSAHNYTRPRVIDCLGVRPLYRTETRPRALACFPCVSDVWEPPRLLLPDRDAEISGTAWPCYALLLISGAAPRVPAEPFPNNRHVTVDRQSPYINSSSRRCVAPAAARNVSSILQQL